MDIDKDLEDVLSDVCFHKVCNVYKCPESNCDCECHTKDNSCNCIAGNFCDKCGKVPYSTDGF